MLSSPSHSTWLKTSVLLEPMHRHWEGRGTGSAWTDPVEIVSSLPGTGTAVIKTSPHVIILPPSVPAAFQAIFQKPCCSPSTCSASTWSRDLIGVTAHTESTDPFSTLNSNTWADVALLFCTQRASSTPVVHRRACFSSAINPEVLLAPCAHRVAWRGKGFWSAGDMCGHFKTSVLLISRAGLHISSHSCRNIWEPKTLQRHGCNAYSQRPQGFASFSAWLFFSPFSTLS